MKRGEKRRAWRSATALMAVAAVALTACRAEGLAFRQDDRLQIVAPRDRATVRLPFRLRWQARNLPVAGPGQFAVFVDLDPPRAGTSMTEFARSDPSCRVVPGCPGKEWFDAHGVYMTQATSVVIRFVGDRRPAGRPRARDRHRLTVIVLDAQGRRVGETAADIEVDVARPRR